MPSSASGLAMEGRRYRSFETLRARPEPAHGTRADPYAQRLGGRFVSACGHATRYRTHVPLALQVCGVLAIIFILATVARRSAWRAAPLPLAISIVPTLLATLIATNSIWPAVTGLVRDAQRDSTITPAQAAVAGSADPGANAAFLSWAAHFIPAKATYFLVGGSQVSTWVSYQLLPRRAVANLRDAQWLIFYGTSSASLGAARPFFAPERIYALGLGIARRSKG